MIAPWWLVQAHDESAGHEGHDHNSADESMSAGLWSGLALALVAALALGLILGARMIRRRAAQRTPCRNCGFYLNPTQEIVCPACGKDQETDKQAVAKP